MALEIVLIVFIFFEVQGQGPSVRVGCIGRTALKGGWLHKEWFFFIF